MYRTKLDIVVDAYPIHIDASKLVSDDFQQNHERRLNDSLGQSQNKGTQKDQNRQPEEIGWRTREICKSNLTFKIRTCP